MPRASRTGIKGLYQDADGRRRIDLRWKDARTGEPRRHQEYLPAGTTAAAARRRAQEILSAALAGTLQRHDGSKPATLSAAFDEYIKTDVAPRLGADAERTRKIHRKHWVDVLGNVTLSSLTPEHVARYRAKRTAAGKEPATVNRELATFKHMVGKAEDWGWLEPDAAAKLRKAARTSKEDNSRVRWLRDDERAALERELAKPRRAGLRLLVNASLWSGCRLGEMLKLERGRVDLAGGWMTLVKQTTKGRKERRIPIGPSLRAVLVEALARSEKSQHSAGRVFVNELGRPYTSNGVTAYFKKTTAAAGVKDFTFHDLRHDHATRLRSKGVQLSTVKELLGHSTIALTERYAHVQSEELQAAIAAIDTPGKARRVASPLPRGSKTRPKVRKKKAAA